jgi:hypothetical protein
MRQNILNWNCFLECFQAVIALCGVMHACRKDLGFPFCRPSPVSIIHPTASFRAVFLTFPISNDPGSPGRRHPWLLPVRKNLKVPHFKRFLRHLSVSSLLRPVCFPAAAYPVNTGSAAIRHSMLPNNRRVKCLSASGSPPEAANNPRPQPRLGGDRNSTRLS